MLGEGGSLQGYALLVPYWSNELGGLVCRIDEMYVRPLARGRGRGSDLLTQVSTGAIGFGDSTVALQLEVSPSNSRAQARHGPNIATWQATRPPTAFCSGNLVELAFS